MYFFLLIFLCIFSSVEAVLQNHYVLGTNGMNSAVRPECATVVGNLYKNYHADSLRDARGETIVEGQNDNWNTDLVILSFYPGLYLPTICSSAPSYGFQFIIPFNTRGEEYTFYHDTLNLDTSMKLGDCYVEPVNITWRGCNYNLFFSYGIYFPTGTFHPYSLDNSGLGTIGNLFCVATTIFLDESRTFTASAFATLEFHGKKRGLDYYPGENLTIDWGIGKTFWDCLTVGCVGYAEWQISYDHGKEVPNFLRNIKDRVYAVGPEVSLYLFDVLEGTFRYEMEFDAHARPQGNALIGLVNIYF